MRVYNVEDIVANLLLVENFVTLVNVQVLADQEVAFGINKMQLKKVLETAPFSILILKNISNLAFMNLDIEIPTHKLAIKLKQKAEKLIRSGHPWIFENSIVKQSKEGNPGDLCIIFDNKKNKFLACGLYDPYSPIRIKVLQLLKPDTIDSTWFQNKIENAYAKRSQLLQTDTNSYRLIFGENDGLPGLIADVYDDVTVVKLYSHIWFPYLKWVLPQLLKVSKTDTMVIRLSRSVQNTPNAFDVKDGDVIFGQLKNEVVVFKEHGVLFSANVIKGHKTGYFLDHRHNRKLVGEMSKHKSVLDVFSYAGGFSVHALVGGAESVTSLDISKQALEMAVDNANLNKYIGEHKIMAVDAFEGLQKLIDQNQKFDIVVIDPPSFAKRETEISGALRSYEKLAKLGVQLVSKGGTLVLASCSSRVDAEQFFSVSEEGLTNSGYDYIVLNKTYHDTDHPIAFKEGAYLKCGYYQIK